MVAAPVKSVKFSAARTTSSTTTSTITGTDGSGVDAAMFGTHNVGAAESVGTYLDTIMPTSTGTSTSGVSVSSGGSGGGRNGKSSSGGSSSKVKKNADGEGAEGGGKCVLLIESCGRNCAISSIYRIFNVLNLLQRTSHI